MAPFNHIFNEKCHIAVKYMEPKVLLFKIYETKSMKPNETKKSVKPLQPHALFWLNYLTKKYYKIKNIIFKKLRD